MNSIPINDKKLLSEPEINNTVIESDSKASEVESTNDRHGGIQPKADKNANHAITLNSENIDKTSEYLSSKIDAFIAFLEHYQASTASQLEQVETEITEYLIQEEALRLDASIIEQIADGKIGVVTKPYYSEQRLSDFLDSISSIYGTALSTAQLNAFSEFIDHNGGSRSKYETIYEINFDDSGNLQYRKGLLLGAEPDSIVWSYSTHHISQATTDAFFFSEIFRSARQPDTLDDTNSTGP